MRRSTLGRCAGVTVALLSIILISFPSFPSTIGFNPNPQTLNRELKGDRQRTTATTKNRPLSLPRGPGAGRSFLCARGGAASETELAIFQKAAWHLSMQANQHWRYAMCTASRRPGPSKTLTPLASL